MPDTKLRRIAKTALTDEIAERKGHVETAPSKLLQSTFFLNTTLLSKKFQQI